MRRILAVAALLCVAGTGRADWVPDATGALIWQAAPIAAPGPVLVTIPPGFHQHADGRIHSDANYGNAAAHEGLERPWPKTAVAGQTVLVPANPFAVGVRSACPTGGCPTVGVAYSAPAVSYSESYSARTSVRVGAPRPVRGVLSWLNAHRPHLFGARRAGGCP